MAHPRCTTRRPTPGRSLPGRRHGATNAYREHPRRAGRRRPGTRQQQSVQPVVLPGTPAGVHPQDQEDGPARLAHRRDVFLDDVKLPGSCSSAREKLDEWFSPAPGRREGHRFGGDADLMTRSTVGAGLGIARGLPTSNALDYATRTASRSAGLIIENQSISFTLAT
ncbi:hypothetical protein HBB16_21485 [Pseudonocardia sp. MCCB 268]|nr:hypothetical protein [Pseudonocardia cytotoxica]